MALSTLDALSNWLQATFLSRAIVQTVWVWPAAETVHFLGLALLIGVAGFFDLRLMGFFSGVSVAAARSLMPLAVAGLGLNVLSGLVFLVGHPEQYVRNVAWWAKVGCLGIAGVNALIFEWRVARRTLSVREGEDPPRAAKVVGLVSLAAWLGVLYWGRMLPFIGNAF